MLTFLSEMKSIHAQLPAKHQVSFPMKPLLLPLFLIATIATSFAQGPRQDRAPALGAAIPKVTAKTPDGKTRVALNEPKRLTVLVFGSHT